MAIAFIFLLGVGNFALHKAVLESGHPVLHQLAWLFQSLGGRLSLILEFVMLLGTLLAVYGGATGWAWFYALYSAVNLGSAWLILTGRV
ncbi:MAG: hypothetical protein ACKOPG_13375 [Novosphingobium sp.]